MGLRNRTKLTEFRCFFITSTCNQFLPILFNDHIFSILYNSISFTNNKYNVHLVGYVFMINHIHLIIYFANENRLIDYMRDFKKFTSGEIRRYLEKSNRDDLLDKIRYQNRDQKYKVWMDRFDDVCINSKKIMMVKLSYIHNNPIDAGVAIKPWDYVHSSAGFYLKEMRPLISLLDFREIT